MLKLTYFDAPGRAYVIRTALRLGGIPFTDEFVTFQDVKVNKPSSPRMPLGAVPVLTLPSGKVVVQSAAIARYAGKLSGSYPQNPEEALEVDELIETAVEVLNSAPQHADPETKKSLREAWAAGKLKILVSFFSQKISLANGGMLVGGKLSLADIYTYAMINGIVKGTYDYVPVDYLSAWPNMASYIAMMEANPTFAPYKL